MNRTIKQFPVVVLLVLIFAFCCSAQGPRIVKTVETFELNQAFYQQIDLCVQASDEWYLNWSSPSGLQFLEKDGEPLRAMTWSGCGSSQTSHSLEVLIDVSSLGHGCHHLDVAVTLEGAQGILGLPLTEHYWILPLNSDGFSIKNEEDTINLESGEWFLLQPKDLLFFEQQAVFMQANEFSALRARAELVPRGLSWDLPSLDLEAGQKSTVTLNLIGPAPAGELVLFSGPYVEFDAGWLLKETTLEGRFGTRGEGLILSVPPLGPGVHQILGSLQVFLPPKERKTKLQAHWQGMEASVELALGRSWFDYESVQLIQIKTDDEFGANPRLLLPDGSIRFAPREGKVPVKSKGLNVVIPLKSPHKPLWVGASLVESVPWHLEAPEVSLDGEDFFLPILLWDQGFTWRLVTSSGGWFLDASAERQAFTGQMGNLRVLGSKGKLTFSNSPQQPQEEQGWQWWEGLDGKRGTWRHEEWQFAFELPRHSGKEPSLTVQYAGKNWRGYLNLNDAYLSYGNEEYAFGARWGNRSLWLETLQRRLRLELAPQRFKVHYQVDEGHTYQLQYSGRQGWHLYLKYAPWEFYFQGKVDHANEYGLRLKKPYSQGPWLSLTKLGGQIKNGLMLVELEQHLGYSLSAICTLYAKGALGGVSTQKLDLSYGVGLIFTPISQVFTLLGWHNTEGWHWKAGVVLPFLGRKTETNSE